MADRDKHYAYATGPSRTPQRTDASRVTFLHCLEHAHKLMRGSPGYRLSGSGVRDARTGCALDGCLPDCTCRRSSLGEAEASLHPLATRWLSPPVASGQPCNIAQLARSSVAAVEEMSLFVLSHTQCRAYPGTTPTLHQQPPTNLFLTSSTPEITCFLRETTLTISPL